MNDRALYALVWFAGPLGLRLYLRVGLLPQVVYYEDTQVPFSDHGLLTSTSNSATLWLLESHVTIGE